MATATIDEQLVNYLQDTHALEQHVAMQLDSMIDTTEDPLMLDQLKHHREETERHKELLEGCLTAHNASPSTVKQAGSIFAALGKGVMDMARSSSAGKNARDGFVAEHMEIAAYELLERVARRAGDTQTVEVAKRNRADEEAMAKKIADNWDRAVELSLEQEGVNN